ncbi:MAG: SUMF1/EgtB/PvdO family nonheme iron enzyme [Saprospiraceae bacterium]|nr:SUMF1/EgtB/PvdO family nonheme iron enzyme [Saprospiraceae bacterium]
MKRYPFKFLDAYTRDDRDIFFGREEEVEALYQMAFQTDLLLVYGASGTGKTSLIMCGLAGRFKPYEWLALFIRRGNNINESLQKALDEARGNAGALRSGRLDWLDEPEPVETAPLSHISRQLNALYQQHFKPLYLIFDQFEELYILGSREEQLAFIDMVRDMLQQEHPVKIVISIREEYLGYLYDFERKVPELMRKKLRVEPMNLEKVSAVIESVGRLPNGNARLLPGEEKAVAEGIFEKIKGRDNTRTIELPYLQVFLDKLYLQISGDQSRQADAVFSMAELQKTGDIGDVLRNFLDEQVLQTAGNMNVPPDDIWKILSPFVTLEGTKEPLSSAMLQERLPDATPGLIGNCLQAFQHSRILRFDEKEQRYEIAHDSLARQVHAKRSDEEIALLEVQRLIHSLAATKPEAREPFSERQLDFITPHIEKIVLNADELDWIEKSRDYLRQQKETEKQKQREELEKAQRQAAIEKELADKANAALAELRHKNVSIFESFSNLGTELIRSLDHDKALEKLSVAVDIDVDAEFKNLLIEPIEELLFFFAESGRRPDLARTAAELLFRLAPNSATDPLLKRCLDEKWEQRNKFQPLLKALRSYSQLQQRYYPVMIPVPLGKNGVFDMGSGDGEWGHQNDETLHQVKLSPYSIAETPVTFYQFALFCEANEKSIASRTPYWGRFGDHPAVNISWYDTIEYANWLNNQYSRTPCYKLNRKENSDSKNLVKNDWLKWKVDWKHKAGGFRLPTEAEWELAARGGVGAPRMLFAGSDELDEVGWYWQNSGDKPLSGDWDLNKIFDNNGRTHAVKIKRRNNIGLYDMSGNAWEWCWDWYARDYYEKCRDKGIVNNPTGAESSEDGRVLRGGSWLNLAENCRVAYRLNFNPDDRDYDVGFRVVFVP